MEKERMQEGADPFDACPLVELRQRRSEKWGTYPPDVLGLADIIVSSVAALRVTSAEGQLTIRFVA